MSLTPSVSTPLETSTPNGPTALDSGRDVLRSQPAREDEAIAESGHFLRD